MKRRLLVILIATFVSMPACSRLEEKIRIQRQLRELERSNEIYEAIQRHSQDEHSIFRLEYELDDEWVGLFLRDRANFKAIDETRFDMTPWLIETGVKPHAGASAILDTRHHTIIMLNTGSNLYLIETILSPLRPTRYSKP